MAMSTLQADTHTDPTESSLPPLDVLNTLAGPEPRGAQVPNGGEDEPGCDAARPDGPRVSPAAVPQRRAPALAPHEVLLDTACAFDTLGRFATAEGQTRLSKAQADIIMHIALFGPANMTELAECLAMSKEHVTRTVSVLEEQGLLTKRRSAKSRRAVEAVLTEAGEREATSIRLASIGRLDTLLACLSPEERDELVDLSTRALALLLKIRLG